MFIISTIGIVEHAKILEKISNGGIPYWKKGVWPSSQVTLSTHVTANQIPLTMVRLTDVDVDNCTVLIQTITNTILIISFVFKDCSFLDHGRTSA